jgi:hypothetical protein
MVDAQLQVKVRLSSEIKEWASARAARNFMSLTSEIAHTLKVAMERDCIEQGK